MQNTLALIIDSYTKTQSVEKEVESKIPEYIRTLFEHYCSHNTKPRFDGIDQIQQKMVIKLQQHIFIVVMRKNETIPQKKDGRQKISHKKVLILFPNALTYMNDKGEQVSMNRPPTA